LRVKSAHKLKYSSRANGQRKNDFMIVLKIHGLENQEVFCIIEREHYTLKKIAKSKRERSRINGISQIALTD
jgi:hypothetical protein